MARETVGVLKTTKLDNNTLYKSAISDCDFCNLVETSNMKRKIQKWIDFHIVQFLLYDLDNIGIKIKKIEERKKKIERIIMELFNENWLKLLNALNLTDIEKPKVVIEFGTKHERHEHGTIYLSSFSMYEDEQKVSQTIRHEIAHYVQYFKNSFHQETYKRSILSLFIHGGFSWLLTGKMNDDLSKQAFREGFAMYISSIMGKLTPDTQRLLNQVEKGVRWKNLMRLNTVPYVLGHRIYCIIGEMSSAQKSIEIGLSKRYQDWISEGRDACIKLGLKCPFS